MAAEEEDEQASESITAELADLEKDLEKLEFRRMFSGEMDENNAYLDIQAGSGGTEAQDWANMLLRMYLRWGERRGFKAEIIELQEGDVAGIKSATVHVQGEYAYGWLRTETGVHRLVRKSPFDSGNRRHTSFASVFVSPEVDDDIDIVINPAELRIDTYRASGAGGQHVNKTDSAIRLTHLPTGIVVECQDERSQHKNRAKAMSFLLARLQNAERERQQQSEAAQRKSLVGSGDRSERIRTYNFPQGRVTDHRINLTLYKLDEIITGDLQPVVGPLQQERQAELLASLADE
jgi:peptide chain release factor 2